MQIRSYFINTYLSSISIRWTSLVVTTMSLNYNPTFGMKPPKRIVKSKVVPANNISGPHLEFQNFKLGYSTPFVKPKKTKSLKRCASPSIIFIQTLLSLSLSLSRIHSCISSGSCLCTSSFSASQFRESI
jgi:hypothetical protein